MPISISTSAKVKLKTLPIRIFKLKEQPIAKNRNAGNLLFTVNG